MTARAFILVSIEPARTQEVADQIRSIPGARVYDVLGPFDVIVDVETETSEELAAVLRSRIRAVSGVTGTLTCTVISPAQDPRGAAPPG